MKKIELFVDQDGVLADYDSDYHRLTGGEPGEKGKVKAARFKEHPHFYKNLPLMPDAVKLWNFVKQYDPKILSAKSNWLPFSKQDKIDWMEKHFHLPASRVIVVDYPNQKPRHCTPGAILIDDNQKNCDEWKAAGGVVILHKNADDTIRQLKSLIQSHVSEAFDNIWGCIEAGQDMDSAELPPMTHEELAEAFKTFFKPMAPEECECNNLQETFDELVDRT